MAKIIAYWTNIPSEFFLKKILNMSDLTLRCINNANALLVHLMYAKINVLDFNNGNVGG